MSGVNLTGATNFFPKAQPNTVAMTLTSTIVAGAATVPITGMTNYADNDVVVLIVDPATSSLKQTFTGTVSGSASQVINCVWTTVPTGGSNVGHSAGATVIDYVSATHLDLMQKGITNSLNQDGSMKTTAVQTALNITGGAVGGWTPTGFAPSAVAANGNRSYTLTFAAANLTSTLTPGMRLQTTRTVAAPTQCTSLNGTTQYYSKATPAGYTFTDSFTYSAWVKPTSYALGTIIGRFSTTGSMLQMNASGQLLISAKDAGTTDSALSYQSLPLNKWSHVAMTMIISTNTVTAYIDGVAVPTAYTNGTTTTVTQAGNLEIGGNNGGTNPFPGKIAQAAVYNAVISGATILAAQAQGLAGTETSLISAYSFNNSINDLNANANNLTANGSAVATNADSPFGGQAGGSISSTLDYGIVTSASFSTNTTLVVQVPEGCTIPTTGGVSAVSYATVKTPYGFPGDIPKWNVDLLILSTAAASGSSATTVYNPGGLNLNIPIGTWNLFATLLKSHNPTSIIKDTYLGLSTSNSTFSDDDLQERRFQNTLGGGSLAIDSFSFRKSLSLTVATPYYVLFYSGVALNAAEGLRGNVGTNVNEYSKVTATCGYL